MVVLHGSEHGKARRTNMIPGCIPSTLLFTSIVDEEAEVPTNDYFDPDYKGEIFTLQDGTKTALVSGSGAWNTVLGVTGKSTGKWYFEMLSFNPNAGNMMFGVAKREATLSNFLGFDANGWTICYDTGVGNLIKTYHNSVSVTLNRNSLDIAVIGVALDLDAGEIRAFQNNVSIRRGSLPSEPVIYSGLSGTFYPALAAYDTNDYATLRVLGSEFTYDPPEGYLPWGGAPIEEPPPEEPESWPNGFAFNSYLGNNEYAVHLYTWEGALIGTTVSSEDAIPIFSDNKLVIVNLEDELFTTFTAPDLSTPVVNEIQNTLSSEFWARHVFDSNLDGEVSILYATYQEYFGLESYDYLGAVTNTPELDSNFTWPNTAMIPVREEATDFLTSLSNFNAVTGSFTLQTLAIGDGEMTNEVTGTVSSPPGGGGSHAIQLAINSSGVFIVVVSSTNQGIIWNIAPNGVELSRQTFSIPSLEDDYYTVLGVAANEDYLAVTMSPDTAYGDFGLIRIFDLSDWSYTDYEVEGFSPQSQLTVLNKLS
jgi:hypothetical protein